MDNTLLVILTALCSGLIATVITLWWQSRTHNKQERMAIFKTLMSKRYDLADEACVEALNCIDVVFYSCKSVRTAWKEFFDATNIQNDEKRRDAVHKKHLRLLEEMGKCIGYGEIKWEDIENYYYPVGLANRKQDEQVLRKVQIDAGIAQLKKPNNNNGQAQLTKEEEMNRVLLMEAIKNPDGILKLVEAAEKAQQLGKKPNSSSRR